MAPPPLPAPQPGFLWVRLRGGRCVLSLRTHQDRQGRSQRAASPHPEEPTAPEGARPADCTTAQGGTSAPHSLGFPELKEAGGFPRLCLGAGEGVGGEIWLEGSRSPADWCLHATPRGCQRWDLGLPTPSWLILCEINQHPPQLMCMRTKLYMHPCGHRGTCTRAHMYVQDLQVHMSTHVQGQCTHTQVHADVNRHPRVYLIHIQFPVQTRTHQHTRAHI